MNQIQMDKLRHHAPSIIGMERAKKSAVCIPLIETNDGYDVLFEVRSSRIESQPGDICFPGGMAEPGETTEETAVREMMEELLVGRGQIEVLGLMDILPGRSLYVYPYAVILKDYEGSFSRDEVEKVFRVPIAFFLEHEPERYYTHMQVLPEENFPYERIHGGKDYGWRERTEEVLFYTYGSYNIWGLTAKMMDAFVRIWKQ